MESANFIRLTVELDIQATDKDIHPSNAVRAALNAIEGHLAENQRREEAKDQSRASYPLKGEAGNVRATIEPPTLEQDFPTPPLGSNEAPRWNIRATVNATPIAE